MSWTSIARPSTGAPCAFSRGAGSHASRRAGLLPSSASAFAHGQGSGGRRAFAASSASSSSRSRRRSRHAARAMIEGGKDDDGDDDSLLSKLNPFKAVKKAQQKAELQRRKEDANKVINDDMRKQLFGDGLVGRMAAGMINNVAGALKEQMSEAAEKSQDCYEAATRAVRNDSRARRYLGEEIQCTPPMSQMSSSMNVNGVATQTTQIMFLAQGPGNGRSAQGSDGSFKVDVAVSLDNGEVLTLDGTSFGAEVMDGGEVYYAENAADAVIDVETATIDVSVDDVKDK